MCCFQNLKEQIEDLTKRNNISSHDLVSALKELEVIRHDYDTCKSELKDAEFNNKKMKVKVDLLEKELNVQRTENVNLQVRFK